VDQLVDEPRVRLPGAHRCGLVEEGPDQGRDLRPVRFQREVCRLEQMRLAIGQILLVGT
jgi:hypothetical protein